MIASNANLPIFPKHHCPPRAISPGRKPVRILEEHLRRRMVCVVNRCTVPVFLGIRQDDAAEWIPQWTCQAGGALVLSNPVYMGELHAWADSDTAGDRLFVTEFLGLEE